MPASKTSDKRFIFYNKAEYDQALAERIDATKKGDRVAVATMFFKAEEPPIYRILQALCAAAQRGVRVHLIVDALSDGSKLVPLTRARKIPQRLPMPKMFRPQLNALEKLQAAGGRYTITNQPARPFTNPLVGHSHIKFAVINNYVFVGGCNLTTIEPLDLMVGWEDVRVAKWLCRFARDVAESGSVLKTMQGQDLKLPIAGNAALLLDSGKAGQSLILDEALALIDAAQEYILLTCQFFPHGRTAEHLAQADARGVKIQIIYNHPSKHGLPVNLGQRAVIRREKRNNPSHFFSQQLPEHHNFLHAKLLVTEQATMLGSHNYVSTSIRLGTAEIALLSYDQRFGQEATLALERLLHA